MMKKLLFVCIAFLMSLVLHAQVGIGTTAPDPAAILDIQSDHGGLLIPRIALTGADDAATIVNPVKGLIIYNTAATGTISEGFVFYDGSAWVDLGWQLQGNYAGTTSFIGTLNDVPLVFKAENRTVATLRPNGAVGFGLNNTAVAANAFALGNGANAGGARSFALGFDSNANAADAFAIGTNALANRSNTIILGGASQNVGIGTSDPLAKFHLSGSFRFEDGNQAAGRVLTSDANGNVSWQTPAATSGSGWELTGNSIASSAFLGTTNYQSLNLRVNNTQIGRFHPQGGVGLGFQSVATANNSVALGYSANAIGNQSLALGYNSEANQDAVALGYNADANGNESIAIGKNAISSFQNIAVGFAAQSSANNAIALGNNTTATSQNSVAIGNNAGTQQNESIAVGADSDATGYRSLAVGYNAQATNNESSAFGSGSTASAASSLALGTGANARGNSSVAIGVNAAARNQSSIAFGVGADSNGDNSIAIGVSATIAAGRRNAIAIGNTASVNNNSATAIGQNSTATGERSMALGNGARASGLNATAVGYNSNATQDNTVILGNNANVGVGTSTPTAKLQVNGTFRYVDASPGDDNGKVLTSDANGNASWQAPSTAVEAYGEMYGDVLGGVSESGTFTRSLNASTVLKNVTHDDTDYYLQVAIAGNYRISYSVSVTAGSNTDRDFEFFVERAPNNNTYTKIDQSSSEVSHENNGQKVNTAKTFYISLNVNDRLRLRYNVTANNGDSDFPANTCNLSVYRLGSN